MAVGVHQWAADIAAGSGGVAAPTAEESQSRTGDNILSVQQRLDPTEGGDGIRGVGAISDSNQCVVGGCELVGGRRHAVGSNQCPSQCW